MKGHPFVVIEFPALVARFVPQSGTVYIPTGDRGNECGGYFRGGYRLIAADRCESVGETLWEVGHAGRLVDFVKLPKIRQAM
jgi:hypothetical protein